MPNFKPVVSINRKQRTYNSYAEIKKNLKSLLLESDSNEISVYRSRRGEWGEWFEHWYMKGNKCYISKQGWQ